MPVALLILYVKKLDSLNANAKLRMAAKKAGPVVTDNGNFIIDADFSTIQDPAKLEETLIRIPGILETGLFCNMTDVVYVGMEDG